MSNKASRTGFSLCPSGFQPVDPWKSEHLLITRRNLPHLEVSGATYFVTSRCCSNLELPPAARDLVIADLRARDGKSIDLDAAVVMPDQTHSIFRLCGHEKLTRVLQLIKGRTAKRINQLLKREGRVWMEESFDHIIRHEAELEEKIEYIRQSPVKDGLAIGPDDYRWLFLRNTTG